MRLMRGVYYLPEIVALLKNPKVTFSRYSQMNLFVTNLSSAVYYFLDNISILSELKLLNLDFGRLKQIQYTIRLLGFCSALWYFFVQMRISYRKEEELKTYVTKKMTPKLFIQQIFILNEERNEFMINIVKLIGEILVAIKQTNIPQYIFNTRLNIGIVSAGGLIASIIAYIQLFLQERSK